MKKEHKALTFALTLAVLVPACYITTEKPADSAPPAVASATAASAAPTNPPLVTATASAPAATATAVPTTPPSQPRPASLPAPKPLPTTSAAVAPTSSAKP